MVADALGKPLQVSTVYRWVQAALARAGLPRHTRLHDLRHTHATLHLARGHALPVVSERLGHRDETTTANLYAHALPNSQRAAARDLDAYISGHRDDPDSLGRGLPTGLGRVVGAEDGIRTRDPLLGKEMLYH